MSIDDDRGNKKEIPDEAIAKEKEGIQDAGSHALAENEGKSIATDTYGQEIKDGRDKLLLLLNLNLYRWGLAAVFVLFCIAITVVFCLVVYLLWNYAFFLVEDSEKLGSFLKEAWKVLTGASVVVFVQIVIWVIKSKMDEIKGDTRKK